MSETATEDSWAAKPLDQSGFQGFSRRGKPRARAEDKKNVLQPPTPDRPFYNSDGASVEHFDRNRGSQFGPVGIRSGY